MTDAAPQAVQDLSDEQRSKLKAAHQDLRNAVAGYEKYIDVSAGKRSQLVADSKVLREAQDAVERAEDRVWRLQEDLLGWSRPQWVPGAAMLADWFSDEDSAYDDVDLPEVDLP
ncbi:MAG: hypothetical protein V3V01_12980 [Acidimicrobiales bacterium]